MKGCVYLYFSYYRHCFYTLGRLGWPSHKHCPKNRVYEIKYVMGTQNDRNTTQWYVLTEKSIEIRRAIILHIFILHSLISSVSCLNLVWSFLLQNTELRLDLRLYPSGAPLQTYSCNAYKFMKTITEWGGTVRTYRTHIHNYKPSSYTYI